jgi:hypothetical protein
MVARRKAIWVSLGLWCTCICLAGGLWYAGSRPGVSTAHARRLSTGMSEGEVEALFGEKGAPGTVTEGGDVCYSKQWRSDQVRVVIVFHKSTHTIVEGAYYLVLPNSELGSPHSLEPEESILNRIRRWLEWR